MKKGTSALELGIIALIINLTLPIIVKPFATQEEITPPQGASKLSFKGQIMHMLVHHSQVPLTSSLIVVSIVVLSLIIGYHLKPLDRIKKLINFKYSR